MRLKIVLVGEHLIFERGNKLDSFVYRGGRIKFSGQLDKYFSNTLMFEDDIGRRLSSLTFRIIKNA